MPRIMEDDIAAVRERARIEEVISSYITLRRAGSDWQGLCPFHDEKTPSFHVTPSKGLYYCFGCGAGGDVFDFVMRHDNVNWMEAVQLLADRFGVQLRFIETGSGGGNREDTGVRKRILDANRAAAEFYAKELLAPGGVDARRMLAERGFTQAQVAPFGVGFAPKGGRELHQALSRLGFSDKELVKAGLIRESGGYDFFQGRVIWPIRDSAGSVLGFGARKLYDDDRQRGKYVNTAETPVYKKSQVLYGLDLARRAIGTKAQAVVMEGYTDVMAAHVSGVDTAVAACGTAFGAEHARLLRRILGGGERQRGQVIFTFDGDAAGQQAALKAYALDAEFEADTSVAVAAEGLDPCDLRMKYGDTAIPALIAQAQPLYRFVMASILASYDLNRADARIAAARELISRLGTVRDAEKRDQFLQEVAGAVGIGMDEVRRLAKTGTARGRQRPQSERENVGVNASASATQAAPTLKMPNPRDPALLSERGVLRLMLQVPTYFTTDWCALQSVDFTHQAYRAVFDVLQAVPFQPEGWGEAVRAAAPEGVIRQLVVELSVEAPPREPTPAYVAAHVARVRLPRVQAALAEARGAVSRANSLGNQDLYDPQFQDLYDLLAERERLLAEATAGID
ncbi:MAG: DNA primase [Propionibacteriaceae bacterium]|jgi:DNA primase|nr:DNA primase [Propionibacteriaceae bacterium]